MFRGRVYTWDEENYFMLRFYSPEEVIAATLVQGMQGNFFLFILALTY